MMDTFTDERDFSLIARDKYTFAVLDRILRGRCDLVLTDHRGLILCHSEGRYPVWIWTPDGCGEAAMAAAWDLAGAHRPPKAGYRFNLKYELAEYFIRRGRAEGLNIGIRTNLCAYDCPEPVPPAVPADGAPRRCTPEDAAEAAAMLPPFYADIGEEAPPAEECLEMARARIDGGAFWFWKNGAGETAACCGVRFNQSVASLGPVYTRPACRRRHYAQHLVYEVSKWAAARGFTPMLYTDADYPASNACYAKVGYVLRGRLCTICAESAKADGDGSASQKP